MSDYDVNSLEEYGGCALVPDECAETCGAGYVRSEDTGCLTCTCLDVEHGINDFVLCGQLSCHLGCSNGYDVDENGCPVCRFVLCIQCFNAGVVGNYFDNNYHLENTMLLF